MDDTHKPAVDLDLGEVDVPLPEPAPSAAGQPVLVEGSRFHGRYKVVGKISAGGMGAVFEVHDERTNGRRALKVMLPELAEDPEFRARFSLEAKITGTVESDHIVKVFDAGIDESSGMPFMAMELLRGVDLGRRLEQGPIAPADVTRYLRQVALALEKTHAQDIVHRDLKPDNMLLCQRDDGSPCIKILDFGIAKITRLSSKDKGTRTMGTPVFMAPEQIRGEGDISGAADRYALGHIAYTLLAGEAYFQEERELEPAVFPFFTRVLKGPSEAATARALRRSGVRLPESLDAWFVRATALEPERRFGSSIELVDELEVALGVPSSRSSLYGEAPWSPPSRAIAQAETAVQPAADADALRRASVRDETNTGSVTELSRSERPIRRLWLGVGIGAALAAMVGFFALRTGSSDPGSASEGPASAGPSTQHEPRGAGASGATAAAASTPTVTPASASASSAPSAAPSSSATSPLNVSRPPMPPASQRPRNPPPATGHGFY